jgi:non-homologous end joining protein Ku
MSRTERAALGRFVMRAKEYLAMVRERDGALTLTTMLFADEVRTTKDVDNAGQKSDEPTGKQLDGAVAVIEELTCDGEPGKYKDRYRARLRRVVDRKRKGETIKPPEPQEEPTAAPDLLAALEQPLAEMRGKAGRRRDGSSSDNRQRQDRKGGETLALWSHPPGPKRQSWRLGPSEIQSRRLGLSEVPRRRRRRRGHGDWAATPRGRSRSFHP